MHIAALIQVVCDYELIIGDFWLSLKLFEKLVKKSTDGHKKDIFHCGNIVEDTNRKLFRRMLLDI